MKKIVVTGINATDNPGPGIPIARCLQDDKNFNGKIIGFSYDALEPGIYMDILEKSYLVPYPSAGSKATLERITEINKKEKIDLIIPALDSEIQNYIKIENDLKKIGIKTFLPTQKQLAYRAKDKLSKFCEDAKINTPKFATINSVVEFDKIQNKMKYPLVIKGIFYEAFIAYTRVEAESYFYTLSAKWGLPIIVQEFLQGDEYNVAALGDGNGKTIGAVGMKKLYITDKGKGWSGVSIVDKVILKETEKIIKKLNWRGGLELEFIKSSKDGKYYLLEINPRFPAWVFLTAKVNVNLPEALVKMASGKKIKPFKKYEAGKIFIRASLDYFTDIETLGKISTGGES